MTPILPENAAEMASVLAGFAGRKQPVSLVGNNSKRMMAGRARGDTPAVATTRMTRILQYEPADLTISVEAGVRWADLQKTLAKSNQMIALDPPFAPDATVGGVIASNGNGPLRRKYGTARDLVIGMNFAMPDGRLVQSGGMVVKNVAGLDMAKLLIGSFGTLAAITSVNFRVHSAPEKTRTCLFEFQSVDDCMARRDAILRSVLQPEAVDVFSPVAAARLGYRYFTLAVRAGGSPKVLDRYARELTGGALLEGAEEAELWRKIREFTPDFLRRNCAGLVIRIATTLQETRAVLKATSDAAVARAGSGVSYVYLNSVQALAPLWKMGAERKWRLAIEFAPDEVRASRDLWLKTETPDLELMKKIKHMFDPENVLNAGRMYGRF
jgi:glycolate oxidase FAD binding subunit